MRLMQRLMAAFNPRSHDATQSHYIPSPNFANDPVELSVWRSDNQLPVQDWKGNTGRQYDKQILTTDGALLFARKLVTTAGLGGTSQPFGQNITVPVAGFAGRNAAIDSTSLSAEWAEVQS